jgi:hypothetical protein
MKKAIFFLVMLILSASGQAHSDPKWGKGATWLTLDIYHLSRALPVGDKFVRFPFNPGFQATYHRTWLGKGSLIGGTTIQAGYSQFDRLFWSMHLGGGIEATWKTQSGFFSNYAIRLDYERLFTGSNNFVLDNGSYKQKTDTGRGYLRITPVDISIGYSLKALRELGLVPAVRFAWALDLPLYGREEPQAWSYTQLGLSINWMIGGQK